MKKILYLFVIAVLLAACTSKNEVRTYNNGKVCIVNSCTKYGVTTYDTISYKDLPFSLEVLIEKDTIWLSSQAFTFYKSNVVKNTINFFCIGKADVSLPVEVTSTNDYYAVMNFGKFFDINSVYKIFYCRISAKDISTHPLEETIQIEDIQYDLDIDQFKQLKK